MEEAYRRDLMLSAVPYLSSRPVVSGSINEG